MEVNVFGIPSVVIVNIPLFTTGLEVNDFDIASFEIVNSIPLFTTRFLVYLLPTTGGLPSGNDSCNYVALQSVKTTADYYGV